MNNSPLVSVIILTYNRLNLFKEALDCVRNQTVKDIEIIVVDNGNQKEVADLIFTAEDQRIKYLPQAENLKICKGRNKGIDAAKGKYIFFLDDDDLISLDGLEKLLKLIENDKSGLVGGVVSSFNILRDDGTRKYVEKTISIKNGVINYLWEKPMGYLGLIKKTVFDDVGTFDTALDSSEDVDFYIRLLSQYKLASISDPMFFLRRHNQPRFTSFTGMVKPSVALNLKKVIDKNKTIFEKYPSKVYAKILRSLGVNLVRAGLSNKAREIFYQSIKLDPIHLKTYPLFLSTFPPFLFIKTRIFAEVKIKL